MVERRIERSKEGGLCAQAIRDFVSHPAFEAFILFTILLNAAFMAVIGPEPRPGSINMGIIYYSSLFFTPLYTAEGLLKIAGFGLVRDERSYFRDPWCIFDGCVILVSWIDLLMTSGSSSAEQTSESSNLLVIRLVRFIRVLRVARAASKLSATKLMVEVVVRGLYNSRYVFLIIFLFVIFNCTLGLSWFSQDLRYRCAVVDGIEDANGVKYQLTKAEYDRLDSGTEYWTDVTTVPAIFSVPETFCRHRSRPFATVGKQCAEAEGFMCVPVKQAAFDGLLNFEDFGKTFLTIIMTIMQQDWERVMIAIMEGTAPPACIFFVFIVVFGSLFLMEYTTAVLCITFVEVSKTMNTREAQQNGASPGRDHFDQALVQVHMGEIQLEGRRGSLVDVSGAKRGSIFGIFASADKPDAKLGRGKAPDAAANDSGLPELSFPVVGFGVNQEAVKRIRARALAARAIPTWKEHVAATFDVVAYTLAGIVMYPACPCEINAAGGDNGFSGADDNGRIAFWEIAITVLSASQVIYSVLSSTDLVGQRKAGVEPDYEPHIQWMFMVPFLLDTALKMIAFKGPRGYFGSILNQMDFWVTFMLFIGLLSWQRPDFSGFRTFRCLRILSLSRWSEMGTLLQRAFGSLMHALNAVVLTAFFVIILAIIGQQIFAGADGAGFSRMYFGSFYMSLISITELSTKSGLFEMIRQGLTTGVHTSVFLVLGCFLMNMIVLKLEVYFEYDDRHWMIPLIVSRFEEAEAFKIQYQLFFGKIMGETTQPWDATTEHQQARDVFHDAEHVDVGGLQAEQSSSDADTSLLRSLGQRLMSRSRSTASKVAQPRGRVMRSVYLWDKIKMEEAARTMSTDLSFRSGRGTGVDGAADAGEGFKSTLLKLKKGIKYVLNRKEFDMAMGFIILVAAVLAGLCTSVQCIIPQNISNTLESIFTVVFSLEFCAKIFAFGFFTSTTGYFKSLWNWLDFLVLVTMWAGVIGVSSVKGAQSLRLLRLIRVIMLLRFFPAIKNAFLGLIAVRKDVMRVFTLVIALLLVFTCIAMQMYGGLLWTCSDQDSLGRVDCSGVYLAGAKYGSDLVTGRVPVLMPRVWDQKPDHFDDFGNAMLTSFFLFLNYDWTDLIERSMSITGPNKQAELMANPISGLPFVACQLVINIMIWQLIVSVVISSVRHADGSAFMTEDQKGWAATKRQISSKYGQFKKERLKGSAVAHSVASNAWFEMLVNVTILINIATMLSDYYGISRSQQLVALVINTVCLVIYYVEMIVTILANPIDYFLEASKLFDFVINIISTIDAVSTWTSESGSAGDVGIQALKALRVLRIARMVNRNPAVSILIKSTIKSFDRAMGCFAIWGIITLLFALWGVQLFAGVRQGNVVDPAIDANFNDVPRAFLWLVRISVGSYVFHVIQDLEVAAPSCTVASPESNNLTDCGPGLALTRAFFIIFCFLCRFVLFPLVAGTIVNAFFSTVDDVRALIKADEIFKFENAWRSMDPYETGYIASWKLQPLLEHLRSRSSVLWFDRELHPGKMTKLTKMLTEAMSGIREELENRRDSSAIQGMKLKGDPGLLPGQLRFDTVLLHLVAFSTFPHALHVPATEHICMVDQVCAATFNHFMRKNAGDIRRRIKMDERAKAPEHKADPLVHQHSMALPTRKDSYNTELPTPRDRLLSRSEAMDLGSLDPPSRMESAYEDSASSAGFSFEGSGWASQNGAAGARGGVELTSAAPTKRIGSQTPRSEDWNDDSYISKATSSYGSPRGRMAKSGPSRPDFHSDERSLASGARLSEVEDAYSNADIAREAVFLMVETDHEILAADKAGRTPFANRMLLDLSLSLDIKTDQVEIRNMTAVENQLVRILVVLYADPDDLDARQPRQLAKNLRTQSMDPNSDLMVLIPQVSSVILKDKGGSRTGKDTSQRSNGNPLDVPENVILQRHAMLLQRHLSELVTIGESELSNTAAERRALAPRRPAGAVGNEGGGDDHNPPVDAITEGIKSFVGTTSSVVQALTPHVMPFLPGKRNHTYAWKGR